MLGHRNFPRHELGSNLGPLAYQTAVKPTLMKDWKNEIKHLYNETTQPSVNLNGILFLLGPSLSGAEMSRNHKKSDKKCKWPGRLFDGYSGLLVLKAP